MTIPLFSFVAHVAVPSLLVGALSKGRFFADIRAKGYLPVYFATTFLAGLTVSAGIALAESKILPKCTFISQSNKDKIVNVSHLFASCIGIGLLMCANNVLRKKNA